ncbi:MAG: PEP-CTERM sorting domain-containing protein [Opitutales bacterium]|nr:PEP-CTERM sorting domain-containing protein [Opitutales bacterium]
MMKLQTRFKLALLGLALSGINFVPAFAGTDASLSYTDSGGTKHSETDSWGIFILENSASDLVFNSGTNYDYSKGLYLNAGTFTNLSFSATGSEAEARVYNKATISGNVSISGSTAYFYQNGGSIASGTKFSLNNSCFEFGTSQKHVWNISSEADLNGLISGTGKVMIRQTTLYDRPLTSWLEINFANENLLNKTTELSLIAPSSTITTSSLSFEGITITVDGWSKDDYTASLDWNPNSANFGKISITHPIPEPSTFGLLAGLCALFLAGTRRRTTVPRLTF